MARTRLLKPEFFKNEELVKCGPEAMLLFAGLWTLADREGRLPDRLPVIHGEIFPWSPLVPLDELLSTISASGFIQRYEIDGHKYIQIVNFLKHQKPHPNETKSVIPCQKSLQPMSEVNRAVLILILNLILILIPKIRQLTLTYQSERL